MKKRIKILSIVFGPLILFNLIPVQEDPDPYLWLEEIDGKKALNWVREKNEATINIFKKHPAFRDIYKKSIDIYNSNERIAYPSIARNYVYNFWQDPKNERGIWRRTKLDEYLKSSPKWETLLDIDSISKLEGKQWVFKGVVRLYPDYDRCLVYLSSGGGDATEVREYDVKEKSFVEDGFFLPTAKSLTAWKDKNTLYVGTDFGEGSLTEAGYPRISKLWKRGTPLIEAKTIFEGEKTDAGVWTYVINAPERQYVLIDRAITRYNSHFHVNENGRIIKLDIPIDAQIRGIFKNRIFIQLKSDWRIGDNLYSQGSLISIDYDDFLNGDKDFCLVIEPNERSSITSLSFTKNLMLVNMLTNVRSELFAYTLKNQKWWKKKVEAPEFGNLYIVSTDDFSDQYFFGYEDFLTPPSLYFISCKTELPKKISALPGFFDGSQLEVNQFEATSKDGTRIPYFLVYPKKMKRDGCNPTLLTGYGGFEISIRPSYSATVGIGWLEKGGVYALANIRGGGEFGPQWHQDGLKENRQRIYDDFIAVAEDMINRKITSPEYLGISGASNGGLLVGVMFTQRPDLFGAAVCNVPLLDMKRYNKLLAGASWVGEYGNPDVPEEWAYIKAYSPYHNVFPKRKYPKVFFTTSTRDDRVHPGHARKMARKMENMGYEFYYYENIEGGHGGVTTNQQRAFRDALIYTYLLKQLKSLG
jgi:prolyl oligopeptidase